MNVIYTIFCFRSIKTDVSIPIAIRRSDVSISLVDEGKRLDEERNVVDRHLALRLGPRVEADGVEGKLEFRTRPDGHRAVAL